MAVYLAISLVIAVIAVDPLNISINAALLAFNRVSMWWYVRQDDRWKERHAHAINDMDAELEKLPAPPLFMAREFIHMLSQSVDAARYSGDFTPGQIAQLDQVHTELCAQVDDIDRRLRKDSGD